MTANRVHAVPGTLLFFLAGGIGMAAGQMLVVVAVAAIQGVRGDPVDPAVWAASHPLLAAGASWLILVPTIRLFGGWLAASAGEDFGIRRGGRAPFVLGAALGGAMLLGPAGLGALLGGYVPAESTVATGLGALPAILISLPLLALLAFGEELLFRGFLLRYWRGLGPRGALVATSLLFALVHSANPGVSIPGAVGVMLAGLMLGIARVASGSLWLPAGIHVGWNAATALVAGLPVSGFELPSLARLRSTGGEWSRGLLGGDFGPEEGLAYHGAWMAGIVLVLAVGPWLAQRDSTPTEAQAGPPSSRGDAAAPERSDGSSSPR